MSGGGGSGGGVFGGRPPSNEVDCNRVRFEANVTSPDLTVAATITVGDLLTVQLQDPPVRRVVVVAPAGIVGSLVAHLPELIHCRQHRSCAATVLSSDGVVVRLRVEPA